MLNASQPDQHLPWLPVTELTDIMSSTNRKELGTFLLGETIVPGTMVVLLLWLSYQNIGWNAMRKRSF